MSHILNLIRRSSKQAFLLILSVHFLLHAPYLGKPAMGVHTWRQTNTLAIAKNYHEIDMRILYPRIDKNYGTNGVTGPQFTSYDFTLACMYEVFGFSETLHRWLSLIISLLTLWGAYKVFRLYFTVEVSVIALLAMVGIPEFYFYSISAVPDLMALFFMLWGWWFFYRFSEKRKFSYALITGLFLALAGMTKLMFLVPGFVFIGEILRRKWFQWSLWIGYASITFIALSGTVFWYLWARYLTELNGLHEFVHQVRFLNSWNEILQVLFQNIFIDAVETWVGYPLLLPVVGGILVAVRNRFHTATDWRIWLSVFGAVTYYIVMQHQLKYHGYYMLLYVPFIALAVAYFIKEIHSSRWVTVGISCVLLAPIWSGVRMHHNWQASENTLRKEFYDSNLREECRQLSSQKEHWIVGPDQSGAIHFYYLGAKGFPWYEDTKEFDNWLEWKSKGASGIITTEPHRAREVVSSMGLRLKSFGRVGDIHWLIWDE